MLLVKRLQLGVQTINRPLSRPVNQILYVDVGKKPQYQHVITQGRTGRLCQLHAKSWVSTSEPLDGEVDTKAPCCAFILMIFFFFKSLCFYRGHKRVSKKICVEVFLLFCWGLFFFPMCGILDGGEVWVRFQVTAVCIPPPHYREPWAVFGSLHSHFWCLFPPHYTACAWSRHNGVTKCSDCFCRIVNDTPPSPVPRALPNILLPPLPRVNLFPSFPYTTKTVMNKPLLRRDKISPISIARL